MRSLGMLRLNTPLRKVYDFGLRYLEILRSTLKRRMKKHNSYDYDGVRESRDRDLAGARSDASFDFTISRSIINIIWWLCVTQNRKECDRNSKAASALGCLHNL